MRPADTIPLRGWGLSLLLPRRAALAALGLGLLLGLAVLASAVIGSASLTPGAALSALFGNGPRSAVLLMQQIRLPRIVAGLLAGAALGTAGVLTQTLARNRLATPDTLGVNDGATLAILLFVVSTAGTIGPWWVGPLGGLCAALLLLLSAGDMGSRGSRVLVMGIALSALIGGGTQYVLAQQHLMTAAAMQAWTTGSLIGRGYLVAVPAAVGLAILLPAAMLAGRRLALLRFDEDVAQSLGIDVRRTQLFILLLSVLLAGLAVGICGPVGFVALAAPIIAGRLACPTRVPVLGSTLVGALLMLVADTIGRVVAAPIEVPVGVITSIIGGPFLIFLLLSDNTARRF